MALEMDGFFNGWMVDERMHHDPYPVSADTGYMLLVAGYSKVIPLGILINENSLSDRFSVFLPEPAKNGCLDKFR